MKQPFRTVGELPLVEVPKKDWIKISSTVFTVIISIAAVCFFVFFLLHVSAKENKINEANQKYYDDRNAQCSAWNAIDRSSCITCLNESSHYPDERCATVSRWNQNK